MPLHSSSKKPCDDYGCIDGTVWMTVKLKGKRSRINGQSLKVIM